MSNSKNRRHTPVQRAATQRRTALAPTRVVTGDGRGHILSDTDGTLATAPAEAEDDIFDLDAVVHEASGERMRFKVRDGDGKPRVFELRTPEEVDWRENSTLTERAIGSEDLRPVLQLLLAEQYEDFLELTISIAQVTALLEQWRDWHGIELPE